MRAHPNEGGVVDHKALLQAPYDMEHEHYYDLGEGHTQDKVFLLNRIDAATSGLLLVALNRNVARAVRELFEQQRVEKTYLGIVRGRPPGAPDMWIDRLERVSNKQGGLQARKSCLYTGGTVKMAKTRIQYMAADKNQLGLSLMRLIPYTGRTHQLRVQCAQRGCPIVGDRKYGDFKFNRMIAQVAKIKRLCLHAHEVRLKFALNQKVITFKAQSPIPHTFEQLMEQTSTILSNVNEDTIKRLSSHPDARESQKKKRPRRRYL